MVEQGSGTQCTHWWFSCHYVVKQVVGLFLALQERASIAGSPLRFGGAMPDRIGNWLTGVDFKKPDIMLIALLRAESSFFV